MAFNTLLATMVDYDAVTKVSVNGANISVGNAKAYEVYSSKAVAANYEGNDFTASGAHSLQFVEEYFPKLTVEYTSEQGELGRIFYFKANKVSDFSKTEDVLATSADGTSYANLTSSTSDDYIGYKADAGVTYFYQDVEASTTHPNAATLATNVTTIQDKVNASGVVAKFFDTDGNGKYDVVTVVEKAVAKVGTVRTSTSGSVTKLFVANVINAGKDVDDVVYPADLAKDDVVLYFTSPNGTTYIEKAESFEGSLTAYNAANSKVTVSGTQYKINTDMTGENVTSAATLAGNTKANTTTFYTDDAGKIVYYVNKTTTVSTDNTLFVYEATSSGYTYQAKVVLGNDATSLTTITVGKTAAYNGSLTSVSGAPGTNAMADGYLKESTFYTYTVENGVYNLTACQNQGKTADTTKDNTKETVITKGASTITLTGPTNVYANANTLYALQKGSVASSAFSAGTKFASYTGVANVAKYTDSASSTTAEQSAATAYVLYNSSNNAIMVVALNGLQDTTTTTDYKVVVPVSGPYTVYKTDGTVDYFAWEAIVDGEYVEEFKTSTAGLLTINVPELVNSFDGAKANGVWSESTILPNTYGSSIKSLTISDSTMKATDTSDNVTSSFALADNAQVIYVDSTNRTATVSEVSDLYAKTTSSAVYTVATSSTNSAVLYVIVIEA